MKELKKSNFLEGLNFPVTKSGSYIWFLFLIVFLFGSSVLYAQELDRLPLAEEIDYFPYDNEVVTTNPAPFIWLPVEGVEKYILQYSQSLEFEPEKTSEIRDLTITVHVPTEVVDSGKWYWRYGYKDGAVDKLGRIREFEIPENATIFPFIPGSEVVKKISTEHPRLHFTPEIVEDIRSDSIGNFDTITKGTIKEAEAILSMNEPLFEEPEPWSKSDNPRQTFTDSWRAMRPYTKRMTNSALAYVYTGDKRFANEAKRRLMNFMEWDINGPTTSIPDDDEHGMDIIENTVPVYDWIYHELTELEREKCREVLSARLHQISYDAHRAMPMETRPFQSHKGRMVGFVIEGSIVLAHEVPEAEDWLDYTLKLLWGAYPAWGYTDGGWNEGPHYWTSYMGRMFRVIAELDRIGVPLKNKPFFQNTGYFGLYNVYPKRPTKSFGDLHQYPVGVSQGRMMFNLASVYSNPYFLWHAETTNSTQLSGRTAFVFKKPEIVSRPPSDIPQSHVFKDVGLTVMHSNMAEPDDNVSVFFQSNPFGAVSHNFACQNAFVIEAYGEPLAISTGYRHLYGSPHHSTWMWQTKAHNSMLVDNEGQVARDRNSKGKIIEYEENGDYVYTVGDATQAYGGRLDRFHRHILYLRPDYIVIIDDLKTARKPSTFQWLLHSPTEIDVDSKNHIMVNRSGNVRLTSRFLMPNKIKFSQHSGFTPQVEDSTVVSNQFHLTASTIEPAKSMQFVTIMKVDKTSGASVKKPDAPSTPRRKLKLNTPDDFNTLDKTLLEAKLLKAEGGMAIRIGNDLILWKDKDIKEVKANGVVSDRIMEIKRNFFKGK